MQKIYNILAVAPRDGKEDNGLKNPYGLKDGVTYSGSELDKIVTRAMKAKETKLKRDLTKQDRAQVRFEVQRAVQQHNANEAQRSGITGPTKPNERRLWAIMESAPPSVVNAGLKEPIQLPTSFNADADLDQSRIAKGLDRIAAYALANSGGLIVNRTAPPETAATVTTSKGVSLRVLGSRRKRPLLRDEV